MNLSSHPLYKSNAVPDMFRHVRGIIFDFDGTLFDHAWLPFNLIAAYPPDIFRIRAERLVRKRFAGCDYDSPEKYYDAFFEALAVACRRPVDVIQNWYFKHYMPRMAQVLKKLYTPRPGVKELFRRLDAPPGSPWGLPPDFPLVAIYSDYPFLRERFEALGIASGLRLLLYGPESFGAQKPAARPFRCIASDMGLTAEEILVIGDREETDGQGAFNAGMRFFCLETGRQRYYHLDPYRQAPQQPPHGPSFSMYSGTWKSLLESLTAFFRAEGFNTPARKS